MTREAAAGTQLLRAAHLWAVAAAVFLVVACGPPTTRRRPRAPAVKKKAVPVERVGLDKDVTTEHEQVSDEVRKEQVDIDDDSRRSS
ncbi:hypothetical protein BH20ACT7_BH20ACT7_18810 [soil metagenome]